MQRFPSDWYQPLKKQSDGAATFCRNANFPNTRSLIGIEGVNGAEHYWEKLRTNSKVSQNGSRHNFVCFYQLCLIGERNSKVASSGLSLSKIEYVVLMLTTFFASKQMTSSQLEKGGSKLGPMMLPYLLLALALPGLKHSGLFRFGQILQHHAIFSQVDAE